MHLARIWAYLDDSNLGGWALIGALQWVLHLRQMAHQRRHQQRVERHLGIAAAVTDPQRKE